MKRVIKIFIRLFFSILFKVEIVNKENVPQKGAAVLCANHIAWIDVFFIGYRLKRLVHYMAKEELFRNPVFAVVLRWLGAFPVKRGTADVGAIKMAFKLVKEDHVLGIFPEGTRRKEGELLKANPGAAMIAIKSGTPIIPVAIEGNYKLFSKVRVIFGKPFYIDEDAKKKHSSEDLSQISQDIAENIYALLN